MRRVNPTAFVLAVFGLNGELTVFGIGEGLESGPASESEGSGAAHAAAANVYLIRVRLDASSFGLEAVLGEVCCAVHRPSHGPQHGGAMRAGGTAGRDGSGAHHLHG
jgi:hypothetical protein